MNNEKDNRYYMCHLLPVRTDSLCAKQMDEMNSKKILVAYFSRADEN